MVKKKTHIDFCHELKAQNLKVSQRDAFNDQSRLGGFIVDVEAAHAAFQFDVHRGDIAQYLRCAASGHY